LTYEERSALFDLLRAKGVAAYTENTDGVHIVMGPEPKGTLAADPPPRAMPLERPPGPDGKPMTDRDMVLYGYDPFDFEAPVQ
jgi:hypothetical protein